MSTHSKLREIRDLCDFSNGHGFGPTTWAQSGLPIIRIQNLNGSEEFNYFSGQPDPDWIVEPGTLLFAWAGTRGVSFGPTIWNGSRGVLNQHIYRVHPKKGVDQVWLYNALRVVTARIERKAHGFKSTLLHVGKNDIMEQVVVTPPFEEQQRIAGILCTWDEALEKLDALIAAKERRKQALMQQLLTGKRRLLGFSEPWTQTTFGQFLTESRIEGSDGLTAQKISVKLYGRGVLAKQERMVGSSNTKYFVRRAGQLIYSKLDFLNGAFGIIPPELDGYESTLDLPSFDVKPSADARWLLAYLIRPEFYEKQVGAATGGRIARRVNPPVFLKLRLKAPDATEQRAIAAVLETADTELRLLRQQRNTLDQQRRWLMQQLLTGKLRVKAA
jgi:type I restriction enzyme S subunit